MYEQLRDYVTQGVLPGYRAFLDARDIGSFGENKALRTALECAKTLYHLREQFSPNKSRAELTTLCSDFAILADICNAAKHRVVTKGAPLVSRAEQVYEQLTCCSFIDEAGEYSHVELDVVVDLDDKTTRYVADILENVLRMYQGVLTAAGVIDFNVPLPRRVLDAFVPRSRARSVDLEILKGEARKHRWCFMEYDSVSKKRKAVDLTGAIVKFRVYKPPTTAPVTVHVETPGGLKIDVDFEVPLTMEQGAKFHRLTDPEKSEFVQSIAMADPAILSVLQEAVNRAAREQRAAAEDAPDVASSTSGDS